MQTDLYGRCKGFTPTIGRTPNKTPLDRFTAKYLVIPFTGCWHWIAYTSPCGYGRFGAFGKVYMAHRFSYELYKGPIPADAEVDHRCFVRSCVNPDHLELISTADNRRNRRYSGRATDTCPQGHPYSGPNLYLDPKSGFKHCRACMRVRSRRYEEKRKARRRSRCAY